jgi:hypothetical protein
MYFGDLQDNFVAISFAEINADKSTLTVHYPNSTKESFSVKNGSIESYTSGVASFTTDDGDEYVIKPVEDIDGEWISEYKVSLPVSNLKKVLTRSQESKPMPYLEDSAEKMLAFQLPEDEYVFGVLYVKEYGAYMRKNGVWVEVSQTDSTFDGTTPYEIGRDNAAEFIRTFDQGALKVDDAQQFLIPVVEEAQ